VWLQGVTRKSEWCRQRYQQIKQAGEAAANEQGGALGPDGQPLDGAGTSVANLVNLTKQQVWVAGWLWMSLCCAAACRVHHRTRAVRVRWAVCCWHL
jgi:hypothetical protein